MHIRVARPFFFPLPNSERLTANEISFCSLNRLPDGRPRLRLHCGSVLTNEPHEPLCAQLGSAGALLPPLHVFLRSGLHIEGTMRAKQFRRAIFL